MPCSLASRKERDKRASRGDDMTELLERVGVSSREEWKGT